MKIRHRIIEYFSVLLLPGIGIAQSTQVDIQGNTTSVIEVVLVNAPQVGGLDIIAVDLNSENNPGTGIAAKVEAGYIGTSARVESTATTETIAGHFVNLHLGTGIKYGIYSEVKNGSKDIYAVSGNAIGEGVKYGVFAEASGSAGSLYGIYGDPDNAFFGATFSGDVGHTGQFSSSPPPFPRTSKEFNSIETITDNLLSKVLQLKPRTYSYKMNIDSGWNLPITSQFGFIAQEMQEVLPWIVKPIYGSTQSTGKDQQYLGINYPGLIPILTEAIKEQQLLIKEQERAIIDLNESFNAIIKKN